MDIGFIGFGEAAYYIAIGLAGEGVGGICAYDSNMGNGATGKQVTVRAQEAGVTLLPSPISLAEQVDVIVCAVPSSVALTVCNQIKGALRSGQIYVDVSASTPFVKKQCQDLLQGTGALFVDAAMLGSLPNEKHRVPISASGVGAKCFKELMEPYGMRIKLEGKKAGDASAIKLVRSIFMKGIAALMIEMLEAASAYGITDEVISSIGQSMDNIAFASHLNRLVTGSALHCARRAVELKGSAAMLEEAGLVPHMTDVSRLCLERLERFGFAERYAEKVPAGWREIIEVIQAERGDKQCQLAKESI